MNNGIFKKVIAAVVCSVLMLSLAACGSSSSSKNEPWNDLGVSEKEYREAEKAVRDADRNWHIQNGY